MPIDRNRIVVGRMLEEKDVGYISTIYFCDKAKETTYRPKYKQ